MRSFIRCYSQAVLLSATVLAGIVLAVPILSEAADAPLTDYIQVPVENLRTAINLAPAAITGVTSDTQLYQYAEALWGWKMLGPRNKIPGSNDQFREVGYKSNLMYRELLRRHPERSDLYWRIARNNYDIGELTDPTKKDVRRALYDEIIALSRTCMKSFPKDAGCVFYLGVGLGRQATMKGILSSLFTVKEIEEALLHSEKLAADYKLPAGDEPMLPDIYYAAAMAYRVLPDSWLVKVLAGTRGSPEKAVRYLRKAVAIQPYRLELQKELAVALICYGTAEDDEKSIAEARDLIARMKAGAFDTYDVRATDEIDKQHATELLGRMKDACAYSRDGYQDVSEDAQKKAKN